MAACKNCSQDFEGKFCNNCGQKSYTDKDKSVKHIFEEVFHFMTHLEGTIFTTLKTLFKNPGKLTVDYCNGARKKYYKPISFYLLLVIIYLIFPIAKGLNVAMAEHQDYDNRAKKIEIYQKEHNLTDKEMTVKFENTSAKISKILLFLFIPASALMIFILFFYKKRYVFDLAILSTEINIMYLLVCFLIGPALFLLAYNTIGLQVSEFIYSLIPFLIFAIICSLIFKKVFDENWVISIVKGIVLSTLQALFMVVVYRFCVFHATMLLL
jgi:Protein of unknown function (DUF3667)